MSDPHLGRSVTIDRAATLLHVSRRTIYNRIRDGRLQTIRTIGGSQRVLVASLDEVPKRARPVSKDGPIPILRPEPAEGQQAQGTLEPGQPVPSEVEGEVQRT